MARYSPGIGRALQVLSSFHRSRYTKLQAGAEATRKQDIAKAVAIERWIDRIAGGVQILHLDAASARTTAKLMNGKSLELFADAMIAAIAITNSLTVATRNTRDFQTLGVPTVNPFIDLR
jgi:predicted nucleic acid-binding protein